MNDISYVKRKTQTNSIDNRGFLKITNVLDFQPPIPCTSSTCLSSQSQTTLL